MSVSAQCFQFLDAIITGEVEKLEILVREISDLSALFEESSRGRHFLYQAVFNGSIEILEFLFSGSLRKLTLPLLLVPVPDLNIGWDGALALHSAVHFNDVHIIRRLIQIIEEGQREGLLPLDLIDRPTAKQGVTAFHLAVQNGNIPVLQLLLEKMVNPLETFENGGNILHVAAGSSASTPMEFEAMQFLLNLQPEFLDQPDVDGNTPLHIACIYRNILWVKFLLQAGSRSLDQPSVDGCTPMHSMFVEVQMHLGGDSMLKDSDPGIEILRYLLLRGSQSVEILDKENRTPFWVAYRDNPGNLGCPILAACSSRSKERKRMRLSEKEVLAIRYETYFRTFLVERCLFFWL